MKIRFAQEKDIPAMIRLLFQVGGLHHEGRPDLFKAGSKKYGEEDLKQILKDEKRPILVAVDEQDAVLGYAFCVIQQHEDDAILTDIKTLYIDDLCVDAQLRGKHIGKRLYQAACDFAREKCCYNLTLNVWSCNQSALKFYQSCGLTPQKIGLEKIL